MESKRINIGTARIVGLTEKPQYFEEKCFYRWEISFREQSVIFFDNLPYIYMGESQEEADRAFIQMLAKFKDAGVYEGDKVVVLYEDCGDVIAISRIGGETWLDVRDHFNLKAFVELGITHTSLRVFC